MSNKFEFKKYYVISPGVSHDRIYDLRERTARFGEEIIDFVKSLKRDEVSRPLIGQIVRSGTSIGANYMEADGAESKKDFYHKIALSRKEAKETEHWLRMIKRANPEQSDGSKCLSQEAHELALIFSSILSSKKESVRNRNSK